MKIKIRPFIILCFICSFHVAFSQELPRDTSYYSNGSIRSILFKEDRWLSGYPVQVFYKESQAKKGSGARLTDTLYHSQPSWPRPEKISDLRNQHPNHVRQYFDNKLLREESGHIDPKGHSKISFESVYIGTDNLCYYSHIADSGILSIGICIIDTITLKNIGDIVHVSFRNKAQFNNRQIFLTTTGKKIVLNINENTHFLQTVYFVSADHEKMDGKYIDFFNNGNIKEVGFYKDAGKDSLWRTFYEDGQLESIGFYTGKYVMDDQKNPVFIKDGEWRYYSNEGSIKERVYYKNGKVIKKENK